MTDGQKSCALVGEGLGCILHALAHSLSLGWAWDWICRTDEGDVLDGWLVVGGRRSAPSLVQRSMLPHRVRVTASRALAARAMPDRLSVTLSFVDMIAQPCMSTQWNTN